ncbi:M23 family metallopeptidase [Zhouia amylolytica]|uniref:M23 family metallopeptidase n=1 Tax=Zhouia amylolytica TaxID=376730 RepID=UPI0020CD6BB3|nr:M23 family metallopeptidase [Zhouia amylolytica]MCQ0112988.1 M23 family metallopeptidase [Zhouia amylolytica]
MRLTLTLFVLFSQFLFAQRQYPVSYFRSPLDIPILLSGTFGELRSNHFHSGLDIKTQGREGLTVHAIGEGYISRIKIQHYGYGKAVYIQHPNGYTSVYAHMQKFSPEIEAYVKKLQYNQQSYEVEAFPRPSELRLDKGELIGYSGNSGSSGGPHLHFEIRDASQKPINPMYFGMEVEDNQPPTILGLFGYALDNKSNINQSNNPIKLNYTKQPDGSFLADKISAHGNIGFGFNAYDRQNKTYNKNGVFAVDLTVNGNPYFSYDFETFSFSETRYINTFIDYERYATHGQRIQQCFLKPYTRLSIFNEKVNNGIIEVKEGMNYMVEIAVKDFKNNISLIKIPIEGKNQEVLDKSENSQTDHYLIAGRDNIYEIGQAKAFFPQNTFYNNFFIDLQEENGIISIHNDQIPVRKTYTLSFDISNHPDADKSDLIIVNLDKNGQPGYQTTYRKGNTLSTRTRNLGKFKVVRDSLAPRIIPNNFKEGQWLSNYRYLKIKIYDDLSGIKDYKASIDGKWILTEYEYKKNLLTYDFSDLKLEGTKHELVIEVTDNAGNSTTLEGTFFRKE